MSPQYYHYTGTPPDKARRVHSQMARHFRLPHLLLLSFDPRNASLPFRRVRPANLSFDVVESSQHLGARDYVTVGHEVSK